MTDFEFTPDEVMVLAVTETHEAMVQSETAVAISAEPTATPTRVERWGIYFDMQEKVKEAFDANGISIPFPQRDIHVFNETK